MGNDGSKTPTAKPDQIITSYAEYKQQEAERQKRYHDDEDDDDMATPASAKKTVKPSFYEDHKTELLTEDNILTLSQNITSEYTKYPWKLLYSSTQSGLSMTTFLEKINLKGPFIVVVRDDKGHVFGGFCDAMLQNESTGFFGSQACFLFTFKPTTNVYRATEANTHYAYFHFSLSELDQQHQYSGFGMGGQKGFFAFGIDKDFKTGQSHKGLATFGSPCLANDEKFNIDTVEVFGFDSLQIQSGDCVLGETKETQRQAAKYLAQSVGKI